MEKIFIACPVSKYIDEGNFTNEEFKLFIEDMYSICQEHAKEVFLALRREEYGKKLMEDTCTELDFAEMKTSDFVVAIPKDSMGVAVELGWASCMGKQILLLLDRKRKYTPLISGLKDITNAKIIWYEGKLDKEILSLLHNKLQKEKKKW